MIKTFSAIQPTGNLTLGNIATIQEWVLYDKPDSIWMIADLHALTTQHPNNEWVRDLFYCLIAMGINKERVYIQSSLPYHSMLAWILSSYIHTGDLSRMTQWKDKRDKNNNVGLYTYPVLMAADILLHNPESVIVGQDQTQHLEFTQRIARTMNKALVRNKKDPLFRIPQAKYSRFPKILDLQNPDKKMSKSNPDKGTIYINDTPDVINKKIQKATTDNKNTVSLMGSKGVQNLIRIGALCSNKTESQVEKECKDLDYGQFKRGIGYRVNTYLEKLQRKMEILKEENVSILNKKMVQDLNKFKSGMINELLKNLGG